MHIITCIPSQTKRDRHRIIFFSETEIPGAIRWDFTWTRFMAFNCMLRVSSKLGIYEICLIKCTHKSHGRLARLTCWLIMNIYCQLQAVTHWNWIRIPFKIFQFRKPVSNQRPALFNYVFGNSLEIWHGYQVRCTFVLVIDNSTNLVNMNIAIYVYLCIYIYQKM